MLSLKPRHQLSSCGMAFLLVVLTGCSQNPINKEDLKVDNAREQFQERREQTLPGQPLAVKPAEEKKVERAVRVLRIFKGTDATETAGTSADQTKQSIQAMIEQSLNALARTLVQKLEDDSSAQPAPQEPADSDAGPNLVPTSVVEEGFVYLNANQVIFEESILLNSFARIHEQGFAESHPSYFAFSGLPLAVVLEQMTASASVKTIIMLPEQQENLAISYEFEGPSAEGLDRLLTQQQLKVVWDPESKNAWVMTNDEYGQLLSRATTLAETKSLKRQSLRSGNEERELSELAARVQDAQLALVRSGAQSFPVVLSDIEGTFAELTPATKLELIDHVTNLRKAWQMYETAPETIAEAKALDVTPIQSDSILEGSASTEETTCLPAGQFVKTVKIFMAYQRPEDVKTKLDELRSVWGGGSSEQEATSAAPAASTGDGDANSAAPAETAQNSTSTNSACDAITTSELAFDDQGLIVTAPDEKINLILNLLDGIDTARKQVLVEVYLVQVNADWRRQIELSLDTLTSNIELSSAFGGTLLNLTRGSTSAGAQPESSFKLQGATGSDLTNLLTFIEQNDIGQTISSPSILALDGQERASVKRTRTLKYSKTVPGEDIFDENGNIVRSTDPTTTWESKPLELNFEISELKVTPANNNVELIFSFTEDTIDSETASPEQTAETKNEINTRILAAPGDVAVLAGLYRQSTADNVTGIPGLTGNSTAAGLLGGASAASQNRSELLVFIAPTVLQPGTVN